MTTRDDVVAKLKDIPIAKTQAIDFFDPKTIHDRILLVEGKKFYVQSGYLMVWSEYFQGLFGNDFKEANMDNIELEEVKSEDLENFLKLIYPGKFEITESNYLGLASLADRFLASNVSDMVMEYICKNLENLEKMELLKFAFKHDRKELKDLLTVWIASGQPVQMTQFRTCNYCMMPYNIEGICSHPSGVFYPYSNTWVRDNIDKILELPLEIQSFILSATVGKI